MSETNLDFMLCYTKRDEKYFKTVSEKRNETNSKNESKGKIIYIEFFYENNAPKNRFL
jgi:hypothetical protein